MCKEELANGFDSVASGEELWVAIHPLNTSIPQPKAPPFAAWSRAFPER